jgi:hypothetical protein
LRREETIDNPLVKREMFAVSLRKKMKAQLLAEKRKKLEKLLLGSPNNAQASPSSG